MSSPGSGTFWNQQLKAGNPEAAQRLWFAAQVAEEYQRLLDLLDESELRNVAVWQPEGHTTERSLWNGEGQP